MSLVADVAEAVQIQSRAAEPFLLQRYLEDPVCYRVLCAPDEVLAAYAKRPIPGELVASVTRGAERASIPASRRPRVESLGMEMVAATGGHIMGADILEDRAGELWALECNTAPGFDPAGDIAERWVGWLDRVLLSRHAG